VRRWNLAVLLIMILAPLAVLSLSMVPLGELGLMLSALIAFLAVLSVFALTHATIGPLTKAAWQAEESGEILAMYHFDDLVVKPVVPRFTGAGILRFKVGDNDVLYAIHPRSIMTVSGSRAKLVWLYSWSPVAIPPGYAALAYDLRHQGYPTLAAFLESAKSVEQIEETLNNLIEAVEMLKAGDEKGAKSILAHVFGDKLDVEKLNREQLAKIASSYASEIQMYLKMIGEERAKGIAPVCIRSYTPEDVRSWLPLITPSSALADLIEHFRLATVMELKLLSGLGRIPWLWIVLGVALLLIAVLALPSLQGLLQGGVQSVGQAVTQAIPQTPG